MGVVIKININCFDITIVSKSEVDWEDVTKKN